MYLQRLVLSVVDNGAFMADIAIFLQPEVTFENWREAVSL